MQRSQSQKASRKVMLPWGKACNNCRTRKSKCDGVRPVCTPCAAGNRANTCGYDTKIKIYSPERLVEQDSSSSSLMTHGAAFDSVISTEYAGEISFSSLPPSTWQGSSNVSFASSSLDPTDPQSSWYKSCIESFLPLSRQLGFAFHISRFLSKITFPIANSSFPHPSLLNAICLWAIRIVTFQHSEELEAQFLQQTLSSLYDSDIPPFEAGKGGESSRSGGRRAWEAALHKTQAHVLISQFFFSIGHLQDGQRHLIAASDFSNRLGLHQLSPSSPIAIASGLPSALYENSGVSPPRDDVEMHERINLFWAVYDLDRCWSWVSGASSILVADIHTPWPKDLDSDNPPSNDDQAASISSSDTVRRFLDGEEQIITAEISYPALRAKASAFYRLAVVWGREGLPNPPPAGLNRLSMVIRRFKSGLVPLNRLHSAPLSVNERLTLLVVHSLSHAAMIELHKGLLNQPVANDVFLTHSRDIITALELIVAENNPSEAFIVDPIIGVVWKMVALLLNKLRGEHFTHPGLPAERLNFLNVSIDRMLQALPMIQDRSAIGYQVTEILNILRQN